ncbi:DUF2125 domain-containing protein [Rhizobiaceae bacterium n13]|uniref:DUF2125 domain-containing protein n=1 Tax=Ferirhizobium litorale TaxID=2927786 RepID=A0AAE3QIA5_9HYPH|nr:DUF2125 domain-containing protein [Fererhizobium litorale]MDI7862598.1 DUF2125 domain-containing protein [Fererhizobium litorale]MDI7923568.1 DUF2125 domain-containing protein [Fererhizobium litorale]
MASSSEGGYSGSGRKFWLLGIGVAAAIALYTAGWFYAANQLQSRLTALLGRNPESGVTVDCPDMAFRGFPFRIGLFCSKVTVDDKPNGLSATFGALRSAAQVYAPWHAVWEMDGPAEIRATPGITLSANWEKLQSSIRTNLTGVDRTSTLIEGITASLFSTLTPKKLDLTATRSEIHLRQNGRDLDAALLFENAQAKIEGDPRQLPVLSGSADLTLVDKAGYLNGKDESGSGPYGAKGELRHVVLDAGDGRVLTLSGPFSISDEGLLSGNFRVEVEKIAAWSETLIAAIPGQRNALGLAASLLKSLGEGKDNAAVDLKVKDGVVMLSFIPIGAIPPI